MQYYVNKEKKNALEHLLFRGTPRQRIVRHTSIALVIAAVEICLAILSVCRYYGASLSAPLFAGMLLLLGGALVFYFKTLRDAYKRRHNYADRAEEEISLNAHYLRYSYLNSKTGLKYEFFVPLAALERVEHHPRIPVFRLTGEFEAKISSTKLPEVERSDIPLPWLIIGDYFEGLDLGEKFPTLCKEDPAR